MGGGKGQHKDNVADARSGDLGKDLHSMSLPAGLTRQVENARDQGQGRIVIGRRDKHF